MREKPYSSKSKINDDIPYEVKKPVRIPAEERILHGDLQVPRDAQGLVVFVHGSGSSRFSPRNKHVAGELNKHGLATLLLDLLTEEEQGIDSETMQYRFDIPLLAQRTIFAASWARHEPEIAHLPVGLFGASTGAAAALITSASLKHQIAAVVSRGGRADLAKEALPEVKAPTLLIVGGDDTVVLDLNKQAVEQMSCIKKIYVVPGATHLFEEPGALEKVASAVAGWFLMHMRDLVRRTRERAS